MRVDQIFPVLVSISPRYGLLLLLLLFAPLPAQSTGLPPASGAPQPFQDADTAQPLQDADTAQPLQDADTAQPLQDADTAQPLQGGAAPPPQGRFSFSIPFPIIAKGFGVGFGLEGRLGVAFPELALHALYSGGFFMFDKQALPLYGIGLSLETETVRVAARATQAPLQTFLPYLATASSFHGGEASLGLNLGQGALDLTGIFRMGAARTLHYLDSDRLLLQATVVGAAPIEQDVFWKLRAVIFFDWIHDAKSKRSKFAIRASLPLSANLSTDGMLLWFLTPSLGYLRFINDSPAEGILTDFLYAPNRMIRGDSTAGLATELRLYPLQSTMIPVLEDLFLAVLGDLSVYHLSPKRFTHLEEHYRLGGAIGLRLFKAVLAGVVVDYSRGDQWQIDLYLKGEV